MLIKGGQEDSRKTDGQDDSSASELLALRLPSIYRKAAEVRQEQRREDEYPPDEIYYD